MKQPLAIRVMSWNYRNRNEAGAAGVRGVTQVCDLAGANICLVQDIGSWRAGRAHANYQLFKGKVKELYDDKQHAVGIGTRKCGILLHRDIVPMVRDYVHSDRYAMIAFDTLLIAVIYLPHRGKGL